MLLFRQKDKQFRNVSAQAGPVFGREFSARGLAIGDYNNDGRPDVLVGVNGGAPLLLKNNAGSENHWVGVRLQRREGESGRRRGEDHLAGRRREALAAEDGRRELPLGARSSRDPRARGRPDGWTGSRSAGRRPADVWSGIPA